MNALTIWSIATIAKQYAQNAKALHQKEVELPKNAKFIPIPSVASRIDIAVKRIKTDWINDIILYPVIFHDDF